MKTILVVDDDPGILELLMLILTAEGYNCIPSNCREAAAHSLELNVIDLVLVDFLLRGEDCTPLLSTLEDKKTPYLVITAMDRSRVELKIPDSKHCIYKPFEVDTLLHEISKLLNTQDNT